MTYCRVCGAKTDAYLCAACGRELEQIIAELPADIADLRLTATRQGTGTMGLGDPQRQWQEPPGKPILSRKGKLLPAHLRSHHGQIALPATPWPYAPGPSDLYWTAINTLTTWARHVAESRGAALPDEDRATPRLVIRYNRAVEVRWYRWPVTNETICTWLVDNIDSIRLDEAAAQMLDEFRYVHAAIDAEIIGRAGLVDYYGRCDAPDVRVVPARYWGPPCTTLACPHMSCALIRGEGDVLRTIVGRCGGELYGRPGDAEVPCGSCGATYPAAERKADLRAMLPDQLAPISAVASGLTNLGQPVTVDQIDGWVRRKRIADRGVDANGHRLVRVGDVQQYVALLAERKVTTPARRSEKVSV